MYNEYLSSSESVVYVGFEDVKERDRVLEKLRHDIPKEYHNTFEKYGETSEAEILLYADFIMIFNIKNLEKAFEKPVERSKEDQEEMEL